MTLRTISTLLSLALLGCSISHTARVGKTVDDRTVHLTVPLGSMQPGDRIQVVTERCIERTEVRVRGRIVSEPCGEFAQREGVVTHLEDGATATVAFEEPFELDAGEAVHVHPRER